MTKEDRELANYILSIIKSDLLLAICWGFSEPKVIKNGLMFSVNGLKHEGRVKVIYNAGKDLFDIQLLSENNELKETIEGVYFDLLVQNLDSHIEKIENYNLEVRKMYGMVEPEQDKK